MPLSSKTKQTIQEIHHLIDIIDTIVIGKKEVSTLTIVSMLAGGHILFEDIPGVGKTLLVKTIAKCLNADFARIQFTPDLIPSDIIGFSIPNTENNQFDFRKGPLFNQLILADEINRTSPRTQAALLEAMSENHVTLDGKTYLLPEPFFVLATQNPIDYEGTYPLPEAQLDRFMFQLSLGYPSFDQEVKILGDPNQYQVVEQLEPVVSLEDFLYLSKQTEKVYVDEQLLQYIVMLSKQTREYDSVRLGISPRGNQHTLAAARAYALLQERDYVIPEDILAIIKPIYRHRLILEGNLSNDQIDSFIDECISNLDIPANSRNRK